MAGEKLQIALYWGAACGGCDVAVLDTNEFILDVAAAADIRLWPIAVDGKYADVEAMEDGELDLDALQRRRAQLRERAHRQAAAQKSKLLVAFGSCAHMGGIPGLANLVTARRDPRRRRTSTTRASRAAARRCRAPRASVDGMTLTIPSFYKRVYKLDDIVPVDYYVPGCPPAADQVKAVLLAVVAGELPPQRLGGRRLRAGALRRLPAHQEREEDQALLPALADHDRPRGLPARAGHPVRRRRRRAPAAACAARRSGIPCRGCYGPLPGVVDQGAKLLCAVVSIIDSKDPEEIEQIVDGLPDFTGFAYRFSVPSSLLQRSVRQ